MKKQEDGSILFDGIAKWDEADFVLDKPATFYFLRKASAFEIELLDRHSKELDDYEIVTE